MPVKDYSFGEIRRWVRENTQRDPWLSEEEIDHITTCLSHIVKWYFEDRPVEGFLSAVLRNNLSEACECADDTNRKVLFTYVQFLYNNLPGDYAMKAKNL